VFDRIEGEECVWDGIYQPSVQVILGSLDGPDESCMSLKAVLAEVDSAGG